MKSDSLDLDFEKGRGMEIRFRISLWTPSPPSLPLSRIPFAFHCRAGLHREQQQERRCLCGREEEPFQICVRVCKWDRARDLTPFRGRRVMRDRTDRPG